MSIITPQDIARIQAYMQTTFGHDGLHIAPRKTNDSAEVLLNGEFIGVIYKDEEDGDISFDFNMAILEMDLPQTASA